MSVVHYLGMLVLYPLLVLNTHTLQQVLNNKAEEKRDGRLYGNLENKDNTDPFQKDGRIKMQLCFFEGYLRANQGGPSLPITLEIL